LTVSAVLDPECLWIGSGTWARVYLLVNAALSVLLAYLSLQSEANQA